MDPITAVGFAASILTFIDFGREIVNGTLEVLKAGSTKENIEIGNVMNDLMAVVMPLTKLPPGKSDHEKALQALAVKCLGLARELHNLLERLTASRNTKWESAIITMRVMRKRGEVKVLEVSLEKYRSEIFLRLNLILNEGQLSIHVQLNEFRSQLQQQSVDSVALLVKLRNDVSEELKHLILQLPPEEDESHASDRTLHSNTNEQVDRILQSELRQLLEMRERLDMLVESQREPLPEVRILRQLYSASMHVREDSFETASDGTFAWILEEGTKTGLEKNPEEPDSGSINSETSIPETMNNSYPTMSLMQWC